MRFLNQVGIAVLFSLAVAAPSYRALAESPAGESIRFGSILILTGEGSAVGVPSQRGIDMAVEDINKAGGVLGKKLEVLHQDDSGDPKKTIAAFRQLTDTQNIRFIIGPTWSNQGVVLIKLAEAAKTVMISPTLGVAEFNEGSRFLFNVWPHDYISTERLAEHVYGKGHRSVALVGAEHVWVKEQSEAFRRKFEQLGGKIAVFVEPAPGTTDLRSAALKIKNSKVDAVVSTTDGIIIGSLVAKNLKDLQSTLPLYSINLDQTAIDAAQGGFEGLEFMSSTTPSPEFRAAYEMRYKTPIDTGADSAYDATMLLAKAFRETNSTDPVKVAEYLATITSYKGASGELASDGKRGFTKPFVLKKVVKGVPQ